VNLLPEFPPRFWVHPGRRLVKQEQFWFVNEAGCQCEPLLPASRQLTRQLLLAPIAAMRDCVAPGEGSG